jgi:hypothetical protein
MSAAYGHRAKTLMPDQSSWLGPLPTQDIQPQPVVRGVDPWMSAVRGTDEWERVGTTFRWPSDILTEY